MDIDLKLDWCSYEAAKYAVEHWHYSKSLPASKRVSIGIWEDDRFVGVIIFSRGACYKIGDKYGLDQTQICELTRVALTKHISPVSKMLSISIKMLKRKNPGLQLIISFADPNQNHLGVIYQAGNWIYTGLSDVDKRYLINGKWTHPRTVASRYGTRCNKFVNKMGFETRKIKPKHRYLYPLNRAMRKQIEPLQQPYPKRAGSIEVDASDSQSEEGGSIPTSALNSRAHAR